MMNHLATYLFAILTHLAPVERAVQTTHLPEAVETAEEKTDRYESIAIDLADVLEETNAPKLFGGPRGVARTGAFVLAVAWMESGFRRDVDLGSGKESRGGGVDSCLLQIRMGQGTTTPEGYDADRILRDRKACFRAGIRMMKRSIAYCLSQGTAKNESLAAYAGGNCTFPVAKMRSKARWSVYERLVDWKTPPTTAELVLVAKEET